MTLQKAVEILTDTLNYGLPPHNEDFRDALKLGIEALKRIKAYRKTPQPLIWEPLSGETNE